MSYLAQVKALRELAKIALQNYPIKLKSFSLLGHGENTTFKVIDSKGKLYCLRMHRPNYHSDAAIREELKWVAKIDQTSDICVPRIIKNKAGQGLWTVKDPKTFLSRRVELFHWVEGVFRYKSLKPKHYLEVGKTLGRLQNIGQKITIKHRNYWDQEGVIGKNMHLGKVDHLTGVTSKQQEIITQARKYLYERIKAYAKKNPHQSGLMHADLHFGNMIFQGDKIGVIDFDDCGHGLLMYDLAVVEYASGYHFQKLSEKERQLYRDQLLKGYSLEREFSKQDEVILPALHYARILTFFGWLHDRSDNPVLKKRFPRYVKQFLPIFKKIETLVK